MPRSLWIADIAHEHDGTIITLNDGSRWQVGPGDGPTTATWIPMDRVQLRGKGITRDLHNTAHGSTVRVMATD